MTLKPIKKRRLFEEIILAIETFIQEEGIRPGERLPSEGELAEKFQVSKTAVREAMTVLQANGIIDARSGAGIFLKEKGETIAHKVTKSLLKVGELQEVFEFRRALEVEAVALAAVRASEEELQIIQNAHEKLEAANQYGALGVEEDYTFHYSIIKACHNSFYKSVFESISEKFEEGISVSKMQSARLPGRFKEGHQEHREIISALFERNTKRAAEAMRNHLLKNEQKLWGNI